MKEYCKNCGSLIKETGIQRGMVFEIEYKCECENLK